PDGDVSRLHPCGAEGPDTRDVKQVPGHARTAGRLGRAEWDVGQRDRELTRRGRPDDVDGGDALERCDAAVDLERARRDPTLDVHLLDALPGAEREAARAAGHHTQERATRTGGG